MEAQEQPPKPWSDSLDDLAAVRYLLHVVIDEKDRQDPVAFFDAVYRVPEHTHYRAVDLLVTRSGAGLTFTFGTLKNEPVSASATFDEIKEIINQKFETND